MKKKTELCLNYMYKGACKFGENVVYLNKFMNDSVHSLMAITN